MFFPFKLNPLAAYRTSAHICLHPATQNPNTEYERTTHWPQCSLPLDKHLGTKRRFTNAWTPALAFKDATNTPRSGSPIEICGAAFTQHTSQSNSHPPINCIRRRRTKSATIWIGAILQKSVNSSLCSAASFRRNQNQGIMTNPVQHQMPMPCT